MQDPWIMWIIQTVTMLGVGALGFFLKQTLSALRNDIARAEKRIDMLEAKFERLPYDYTTKEDFIRAVSGFETKLDKLFDKVNELKRG